MGAARPAEYTTILSCLATIRRRLFTVRLMERLALGLATGAAVALPVIGARLLRDRYPEWAAVVALLPGVAAGLMWVRAWRWAMAGIPAGLIRLGAGVAVLGLLLALAVVVSPAVAGVLSVPWLAGIVVAAGAVVGASTVRPVAPQAAAIFVDQQVGLRERVSTALELLDGPAPASRVEAAFRQPLVASAVQACAAVKHARVGYARLDRRVYAIAATAAIAAVGLAFLTPLPAIATQQRKPYVKVVESTAKLADKLKEIEEQQKHGTDPALDKKLQPLKDALADLRKGNMSPFEAGAKLSEARAELQKEKDQMDAADSVEKALEKMKAMDQLSAAADKAKEAEAQAGSDPGAASAKKAEAQNTIKAAADATAAKAGGMTDGEKKDMADGLKAAADQAKDNPELQKSLNDAASAAEKGDTKKLSEALADAAGKMGQQSGQRQVTGQALKDAMDAIDQANAGGKSADEQLASGTSSAERSGGQQGEQNSGGQQGEQKSGGQQGGQPGGQQNGQPGGEQGGQQSAQGGGPQQGNQPGDQQGSQAGQGQSGDQTAGSNGSTNFHNPGGPGDQKVGGPIGRQTTMVKIYEETHIQSAGDTLKVQGQLNPKGPAAGTAEVMGEADRNASQIGSYGSQLPAARQKAMDDLQTQQIPPQYRDVIRSYYEN